MVSNMEQKNPAARKKDTDKSKKMKMKRKKEDDSENSSEEKALQKKKRKDPFDDEEWLPDNERKPLNAMKDRSVKNSDGMDESQVIHLMREGVLKTDKPPKKIYGVMRTFSSPAWQNGILSIYKPDDSP